MKNFLDPSQKKKENGQWLKIILQNDKVTFLSPFQTQIEMCIEIAIIFNVLVLKIQEPRVETNPVKKKQAH